MFFFCVFYLKDISISILFKLFFLIVKFFFLLIVRYYINTNKNKLIVFSRLIINSDIIKSNYSQIYCKTSLDSNNETRKDIKTYKINSKTNKISINDISLKYNR